MTKILNYIAIPLGYLLTGIYELIGNYGVTLIIFTFIVRLCLFPLYANQIKHQIKMQDVQPKMQAIQKKYAHDREEQNRKMMELYKEENFNPMRGCLPMLIQMPILFGLFALLRDPGTVLQMLSGNTYTDMIFAVHEAFLWMKDLSQPDLWILPILAGITTYFSFSLTQAQTTVGGDNSQANQMAGMMKMMKYFFPVMIVWMGRSFPAGLALYWFIGNICTMIQYQVLRLWRKKLEKMRAEGKGGPLFPKDKK